MSKRYNKGHGQNYPGRPRRCDVEPGSKACKKRRANQAMLCKACTAWQQVG